MPSGVYTILKTKTGITHINENTQNAIVPSTAIWYERETVHIMRNIENIYGHIRIGGRQRTRQRKQVIKMNNIKEARIAAGLTQQQMSDLLRIPKRTIGNWEDGSRKPPEYVECLIIDKLKQLKGSE